MIVRKLRLEKGWSQEQLAQLSGLSIRTIQRLESGQPAGLETLKSLAAVFEVQLDELTQEDTMISEQSLEFDEKAKKLIKDKKGFYLHVILATLCACGIYTINFMVSPWYLWANWAALGLVSTIIIHGILVIDIFFGADWEKKQIEKKFGKKEEKN